MLKMKHLQEIIFLRKIQPQNLLQIHDSLQKQKQFSVLKLTVTLS